MPATFIRGADAAGNQVFFDLTAIETIRVDDEDSPAVCTLRSGLVVYADKAPTDVLRLVDRESISAPLNSTINVIGPGLTPEQVEWYVQNMKPTGL